MDKTIISKDTILSAGKEIIIESGLNSLSIRDVANKCGISIGSVYNYFPSKSDLIVATIESVWIEIIMDSQEGIKGDSFLESISYLFNRIKIGCENYPSFFSIHSMSAANFNKNKGREVMDIYFKNIKTRLLESLNQDNNVRDGVFNEEFTKTDFIDFTFYNIITLFMKKAESCDFLLELVKRIIY